MPWYIYISNALGYWVACHLVNLSEVLRATVDKVQGCAAMYVRLDVTHSALTVAYTGDCSLPSTSRVTVTTYFTALSYSFLLSSCSHVIIINNNITKQLLTTNRMSNATSLPNRQDGISTRPEFWMLGAPMPVPLSTHHDSPGTHYWKLFSIATRLPVQFSPATIASTGISRRRRRLCVCVCLSVCLSHAHTPVLCQNG